MGLELFALSLATRTGKEKLWAGVYAKVVLHIRSALETQAVSDLPPAQPTICTESSLPSSAKIVDALPRHTRFAKLCGTTSKGLPAPTRPQR